MERATNRKSMTRTRQALRKAEIPAEQRLWARLRRKALCGYRFRRQVSLGSYVVDFFCFQVSLVIELDGESHFRVGSKNKDDKRQEFIKSQGYHMLRFTNTQVYEEIDAVVDLIFQTCQRLDQHSQDRSLPS